jgi:hypothetical protein
MKLMGGCGHGKNSLAVWWMDVAMLACDPLGERDEYHNTVIISQETCGSR